MKIIYFIKENLYYIHKGDLGEKIDSTFKLGAAVSPLAYISSIFTDWFSLNSGYVIFVFIAIIMDHLIGTYVHLFIKRDFSMKKNITGFFTKTVLAIFVGVIIEGMTHIMGVGMFVTDYFSILSRLMVFIYPAGSALMNISIMTNGSFPPTSWINKIMKFNTSMNLKEFKESEDE